MKIFCFFGGVPQLSIEDETRLIMLWRAAWRKNGFEPIVLNEFIASRNPLFEHLEHRVKNGELPSVNPWPYDFHCYVRWLAMAEIGGGIMSDYDVMPYGWKAPTTKLPNCVDILQGYCPCMVLGSRQAYLKVVKAFLEYKVTIKDRYNDKPHISDMYIIQNDAAPHNRRNIVRDYGQEGWEEAPLVHFNTSQMTTRNLLPRWKHIPILRNPL